MSKITTFSGQPQYLQILNLASRAKIQEISKQKGYNKYTKFIGLASHFLLYCQLYRTAIVFLV